MNLKIDNKDYDSEKLSDKGKIYLGKLQNLQSKLQQINLEIIDLNILQKNYSELLKKELPKEEVKEVIPDKK
jgi:hypothetical protein